jgi:hypothetical protein
MGYQAIRHSYDTQTLKKFQVLCTVAQDAWKKETCPVFSSSPAISWICTKQSLSVYTGSPCTKKQAVAQKNTMGIQIISASIG